MKNLLIAILLMALLGAGYYIYTDTLSTELEPNEPIVNVPDSQPQQPNVEWTVYTDKDYRFQVSYPAGWKVATQSLGSEPVISIYRTGEPPYSHHVNASQVSIFPKGLGTEGPVGENRVSAEDLTMAQEMNKREFFLVGNQPYAYTTGFETHPAAWMDYGYVWASVLVKDKQATGPDCQMGDTECDPYNDTKVSGSVDRAEFQTVKEILKTFRFN